MLHMHITSWALVFILFILSLLLNKNNKGSKIVHMILRLFYVFILISGTLLLHSIDYNLQYLIKGILGILAIGLMEMILVRLRKQVNVLPLSLILILIVVGIFSLAYIPNLI